MSTNENRRVRLTKQMIKQAMIELLEKKDIHHVTVRELCEKADVNRATFYKYYDNPYHLMDEMNKDFMKQIDSYVECMSYDFKSNMIILLQFIEQNQEMCRMLIKNHSDSNYLKSIMLQPAIAESIASVFALSNTGGNPYLRDFILYGTYHVILNWLLAGCPEKAQNLAEYILSFNIDLKG